MLLIRFFGAICFTAFCAAQDPQNERPLLSVKSAWLEVFPSEKVQFTCNFSSDSNWNISWYRDEELISESRSVGTWAEFTLTAEKQNSGNYSCIGVEESEPMRTSQSNQIYVKVYDSPFPTVSKSNDNTMFLGESVTFTCTVGVSSGWEYVWYHNKKEISALSINIYTIDSLAHSNSGDYSCKARRGKDGLFYTNEAVTSLQISDPPTPSLKRLSLWSKVFENETVEFSCSLDSSDWKFTWYRNNEKLLEDKDGSSYRIDSVMLTDEGNYTCRAHHKYRRITSGMSNSAVVKVYKKRPTPSLTRNYGFDFMYVGEMVNFTCTVDVASDWQYEWFKDKNRLPDKGSTISITLGTSNAGKYSCAAIRGGKTLTDFSKEIVQHVLEIPVPSLKKITQWLDVFPTESVKLTCGLGEVSNWTYTWQKDGQKVQADKTLSFESNGATLLIRSASAEHKGQYICRGHIQDRFVISSFSSGLWISVYDNKPNVTLTQDPEYQTMFPGESVTFKCDIKVFSGWEYLWYKDDKPLNVSLNMYKINPVQTSNAGSYKCRGKRGSDQPFFTDFSQIKDLDIEKWPEPSITRQPDTDKLYTGESMSYECKVEISSGWDYQWYKDNKIHSHSSHLKILNVSAISSGNYKCMATRQNKMYKTNFSDKQELHISEIPVPILKQSSQYLDVFPTETVKLSCGTSSVRTDWTYTWYRDGEEVQADDTVTFDSDKTTLTINSASASHRGDYKCSGKFKSRPVLTRLSLKVQLHVYDTKPNVRLIQTPEHEVMHTGDSVSFTCHNNVSTGWEYVWYKDDVQFTGPENNFSISSVAISSRGSYKCQVKRGKNTVFHSESSNALKLKVEERPQAKVTLLTGWSEVFSTDTLLLKCEVENNNDVWNYTWFKEGTPISPLLSAKHAVTPQNDPEQSLYTCKGIRTGRPSYSKPSNSFKTKNLLLKRRVLLSISGCIFFGIIAVFLGCIALRVMRKPAHDEYKPDEANLFLTMAQLKNCADAPCPLVDYVTEEALNAPSKEEEENGTICSETTPLPISREEDQDVKTENNDKEENNGGLVSFKQ